MPLPLRAAWRAAIAGSVALTAVACQETNVLYCESNADCAGKTVDGILREYCDVDGTTPASEGIGRTCVPWPDSADVDAAVAEGPDASSAEIDAGAACAPSLAYLSNRDGVAEI